VEERSLRPRESQTATFSAPLLLSPPLTFVQSRTCAQRGRKAERKRRRSREGKGKTDLKEMRCREEGSGSKSGLMGGREGECEKREDEDEKRGERSTEMNQTLSPSMARLRAY